MQSFYFNRGVYYLVIGWVLTVILWFAVALRLYSRSFLTRSLGSDDVFIVVASVRSLCYRDTNDSLANSGQLLSSVGEIGDTLAYVHGLGRHAQLLDNRKLSEIFKW